MAKLARDTKYVLQSQEGLEDLNLIIIELNKEKPDASKLKQFALKYGFKKSLHKNEDIFIQDIILTLNLSVNQNIEPKTLF